MELVYEKFGYNSSFNSEGVADLLDVQLKTAGRLLVKAEKIGVLESEGSTKKKRSSGSRGSGNDLVICAPLSSQDRLREYPVNIVRKGVRP